jgi:hypothetical protein
MFFLIVTDFISGLGVQKERMVADDMYVMAADGKIISAPRAKPWPHKHPKCSDCAPLLFMKVVRISFVLFVLLFQIPFACCMISFMFCSLI